MSNHGNEHRVPGIALDDRSGEERPIPVMGGSWRRSLPTWAGALFLVALGVTGILGLSYFSSHVAALHNQAIATEDQPGGGVITRSVMRDVWFVPSLVELAKCRTGLRRIDTFGDLKTALETHGQERLWYAVTFRAHQVNGAVIDLTVVRQPYRDPGHFPEFQTILSLAAEDPPHESVDESLAAAVHLLPEGYLGREPLEVMRELVGHP